MKNLVSFLSSLLSEATIQAFPQLMTLLPEFTSEIFPSSRESFGQYQCNSAMKLAKVLRKSPRQIAETIVAYIDRSSNSFSKIEVADPGFINMTLDPRFLAQRINILLGDPHLGVEPLISSQKVIVDFSSPNIAKEMHVGHLRSTIIGDCLARLFEFMGYDVLRLNHVGDWGTSFGMLIAYMKECAPQVLTGNEKTDLTHLVEWYRMSKKRFDEDPSFKKASQLQVVGLQQGDSAARKAWEIICEISRNSYQEIYDLLDISLIERGESFYNPLIPDLVNDLEKKGLITISDGAKCVFIEGFQNREGEPLPLMIQKSDGGYNYDTTDMAAIRHRLIEEKGLRLVYVTDAGQSTHFEMIFRAAEKAGYLDPKKVRVDHVPFGLVLGADGKKFRTRTGDTERLIDLIETAISHADQILKERSPDMEPEDRHRLARSLGIGAIKYADLSNHRLGDYTFSYDRMLKFEGNTAAFLMYSYVRTLGIKRRLKADIQELIHQQAIVLEHPSEIELGLYLLRFPEALELVANDLLPNRLTDYLYALADKFNAFFRDCRVEGTPQQNSRLLICEVTSRVLYQGLTILGLPVVDRM